MERIVIASLRHGAGKTSVIVGMAKAMGKRVAYMKPFGDRLLYKKKRLWDYDSALVTCVLGLQEKPEDMSIGFDHSKLSYMYDESATTGKLREMVDAIGDRDVLFIEAGSDIAHGSSVHLDAISVANAIDGKLVVVVGGDEGAIMDDVTFLRGNVDLKGARLGGIIINKVKDVDEFTSTYLPSIKEMGINVLGVLPFERELTYLTLDHVSSSLFAKVVAGEGALDNVVKNIFVGAMSANAAQRNPLWKKDAKLLITSGDRSDIALAALDGDTAGLILTNNILPQANIVAKAAEMNVPVLLVSTDTFSTAKSVDDMEALLTKASTSKIDLLERLARDNLNLEGLLDG